MRLRLHGLSLLIALFVSTTSLLASPSQTTPIVFTAAKAFNSEAWIHGAERFPLGASLWTRDNKGQRQLFPAFAASADANVSFDGTRILFAGKKHTGDPWQIWEATSNGAQPKQVTHCKDQCVRPLYLPDSRIVFAERKSGRFVIETAPLDEARSGDGAHSPSSGQSSNINATPLTFIPGSAFPSDVLRDGRVLFEAVYPLGAGTKSELYTVYTDGSGVESYRCDHGADRHSGKQNAVGDIVFASADSLVRFTSPLAHADAISAPKGQFAGDVVQMPSGEWLRHLAQEPCGILSPDAVDPWNAKPRTTRCPEWLESAPAYIDRFATCPESPSFGLA